MLLKILAIKLEVNNVAHFYFGQQLYGTDVFNTIWQKRELKPPEIQNNFKMKGDYF